MEDDEFIEEVEYLGKIIDPRKERVINNKHDLIEDHEELETHIESIKDIRDKIITLQLYIERAIDRIIDLILGKKISSFHGKIDFLKSKKLIDEDQFYNFILIKELRGDYAHILKVEEIEPKYSELVKNLRLSGYVYANPHYNKFQLIIHQILFELKDIYDKEKAKIGEGKIEKGLTDEEIKDGLEKEGRLFWQYCKILKYQKDGYIETYHLQCPYCNKGEIVRERDGTPGFKESYFHPCPNCGLGGDGSYLEISSIKKD